MLIYHPIKPVFDENSKVLILGSFPSPKSREAGFFYGHPQNRFWKVMSLIFDAEIPDDIEGKKAFLLQNGIAMWDVINSCEIVGASDSTIANATPNDFETIFSVADIRAVFTTGATATRLYKQLTGRESICLPSPSPANCAVSLDRLAENYKIIREYL
ncbi:MAG TPA: DNA-deoxyinosine glycosylase [Clostridia bacterium]|jgi:hypoxanthine-DNA glycosylase|nr:DNA-deoxyinosine glycosylase [Clostridia bacterium]